jgi:outer membrane protein OmpA-like peptidoglycan-associated protein/uncharacterized protein YegP (UPF0339 family)
MITKRDDDYLICKEYYNHINQKSAEYPDFITFKHANGNHYFAWVYNGEIVLRSEAYPDAEKMERGIKAIIKNWDLPERYSIDSAHGVHFLVLWGGGDHTQHTGGFSEHNEIGRSCPKKSREELNALLHGKGKAFADKVVPIDKTQVDDDIAKVAAGAAGAAISSSLTDAAKTTDEVKAAPASVAAGSNSAASGGSGSFNWKWLLPLLLLPVLFFGWRSCNKPKAEVAAPDIAVENTATPAEATAVTSEVSTDTSVAAPTQAAAPDCNLNWILFDFDKFDITSSARTELETMAKILKDNPSYTGSLSAHTDSKGSNEYNNTLSLNRANEAKKVLVNLGIEDNRIKTSADSESAPIATNTDDDTGRRFNRRVELRVYDGNGKEICTSIPPAVPADLKN